MAPNWLVWKSKGKAIWKDVQSRGLELAETLTEKRTREYKARTKSKAESEAFEAKQKVREVIRMNNKWAKKDIKKLESENEGCEKSNSYLNKENKGCIGYLK